MMNASTILHSIGERDMYASHHAGPGGSVLGSETSTVRRGTSSKRSRPWAEDTQQHTRGYDMTISTAAPKSSKTDNGGSLTNEETTTDDDHAIRLGRLLFAMSHLTLAFILAALSYAILANKNKEQADVYFEAFADRVHHEATRTLLLGRSAATTMATLASEVFPHAEQYPFAFVPGFERIVQDLLNSGNNSETMGYAPIVWPDQLEAWEQFAYDYYYNKHLPHPFPNTTGVSSFGRGVWALDVNSTASDQRYHDTGLECTFNCSYQLLAPIFQVDGRSGQTAAANTNDSSLEPEQRPRLLYNLHSDPARGAGIESVLDCVQKRAQNDSLTLFSYEGDASCGMVLPISTDRWLQGTGPFTINYQPVRPAKNRTVVTGIMFKLTSWDQIMAQTVSYQTYGHVYCVISDSTQTFTYRISGGQVTKFGKGDSHDEYYDSDGYHFDLIYANQNLCASGSPIYTLSVYPTEDFYNSYDNGTPEIATVVSLFIMLFISLCFCFYDTGVRRVALERNDFIQARHRFMRFVSHEVRTPLNAVTMGLDVISDALEAVTEGLRETGHIAQMGETAEECANLVQDVKVATQQSVGVLSDVLNYEKIEQKNWIPDARLIPIWEFLENVSQEFPQRATEKHISLEWAVRKPKRKPSEQRPPADDDDDDDKLESNNNNNNNAKTTPAISNGGTQIESDCLATPPNDETDTFHDIENNMPTQNVDSSYEEEEFGNLCLVGDVLQLTQVLHNLVGNSFNFTPELGSIKIKSSIESVTDQTEWLTRILPGSREKVTLRKFGQLNVTVSDTGPGLSREQQRKLHSKFNPDTLQTGRVRLSIFISKAIVENHGGKLAVKSEVDRGCAFRVTIPVYQSKVEIKKYEVSQLRPSGRRVSFVDQNNILGTADGGAGSTSNMSTRSSERDSLLASQRAILAEATTVDKLRLLIVDDAASNRKFLRRLLERKGHTCDEVEDGQMAVDIVRMIPPEERQYDCILMDFQMPEMDGPTATKVIRSLGYDVLIVGVTGNLLTEDVDYFLGCGANAVLGKPIHLAALDDLWIKHGLLVPPPIE